MSLDDWHPIRELREREAWVFQHTRKASDPRHVLIYSMDPWQLAAFEQFLHLAIERKGHRATTVFDDGLLPLCAWENHTVAAPPREKLTQRFEFMHACFGIDARGTSTYLPKAAAQRAVQQLIDHTPDERLATMEYGELPVGRIALRDLTQYSLGRFEPRGPEDVALLRRHLVHAVMSIDLARTILDTEQPDIVVLVNGKSIMYSYMYELARHRGIAVTTWEEGGYHDASVVLANDARAIDFPVDETCWQAARRRPLSPRAVAEVDGYFDRLRRQKARFYTYYDHEERDFVRIRRELRIPEDARIVSLFSNIIWDTNALEKDLPFASMFDWIRATIDWAAGRPDRCLVVRAHPGEAKLCFRTRTPINELIRTHYGNHLPKNVRLVDPQSEFSSYEIAAHSEHCAVYTSTLGAELALAGLHPLICGTPFYRGKAVTCDIDSPEQYFEILDGRRKPPAADVTALRKLLHLVIFRLVKRPEFFHGIHDHPQRPRVVIDTFEGFPDSMPIFNDIVDCILERRSFTAVDSPGRIACPA